MSIKPNVFTCSPVRIIVDSVERDESQADTSGQGAITINEQRLEAARAVYGEQAEYWLGLQDSIAQCKGASVPCVINIGGEPGSVALPVNKPVPTPLPTPSPTPKP